MLSNTKSQTTGSSGLGDIPLLPGAAPNLGSAGLLQTSRSFPKDKKGNAKFKLFNEKRLCSPLDQRELKRQRGDRSVPLILSTVK